MNAAHARLKMDGPTIVIGGPLSNLEATVALLAEARRLGVPEWRVVCTGDVVAYCADAHATVDVVRRAGIHVVMGNCEENLAAAAGDCGCGFVPGSACERLSAAWFAHADREIDADARRWMAQLPRRLDIEIGGRRLAVFHGAVTAINRYIFASTAPVIKEAELNLAGVDGILAGHSGIPFTQIVNGRLWHNAGALGLPANDGTPRVWFSLLTPEPEGLRIEHRALAYDHAKAAAKFRQAGLPEDYASTLSSGLWPSCDILPYREIREKGVPLTPGEAFWRHERQAAPRRHRNAECQQLWPSDQRDSFKPLKRGKFRDLNRTAGGEPRASVALRELKTLWFNTGTLCNITCRNCYIESSPKNDRLAYLTRAEVTSYLDEIERDAWDTEEIAFTGGEPFMNPDMLGMMEDSLARGFRVLVLTNAMRPMQRLKARLLDLNRRLGTRLTLRVSLDHFTAERHEDERGPGTFQPTLEGLVWLARNGFRVTVAGRTMWGEDIEQERAGYARLFAEHGMVLDVDDPSELVLFPEMDGKLDVPEITKACWDTLGKSPDEIMCAGSRMVVKRKGADKPAVLACTLIPYDPAFELGTTLREAARPVLLNHPHCAQFCVLGGASCSAPKAAHEEGISLRVAAE